MVFLLLQCFGQAGVCSPGGFTVKLPWPVKMGKYYNYVHTPLGGIENCTLDKALIVYVFEVTGFLNKSKIIT